jgi:serine/threonine protein kinase
VVVRDGAALPNGSRLQELEIEGLIGEGGFSIVYRARDTLLNRTVALKEYLPASLARRGPGHRVAPPERHRTTFELGLRSFINEAQLLASFDHPSLVKVYRFWEENGTAYMAMPFYQGQTMMDWLRVRNAPAGEAWLRAVLTPLLDAIELMHSNHCYHRDIAPDNVLLLDAAKGGVATRSHDDAPHPVLLDFGAARRVIGDATQALTAILKPGFAPIEQYSESKNLRQGPWTDIYALCALLYHAVTGHKPMPSAARVLHDELIPASSLAAGRCTPAFLHAIDQGMAIKPQDRPQSVQELRALLDATALQPTVILPVLPIEASVATAARQATPPPGAETAPPPAASPQPELRTTVFVRTPSPLPDEVPSEPPAAAAATFASRPGHGRRALVMALAAPAVAVVVAGLWYGLRPSPTSNPAPRTDAVALPATPPVASAAATPFSVMAALTDIVQGADPALQVDVRTDKPTLKIGRESLRLHLRSSQAGYVYVYTGGTEKSHFYLLFPNRIDRQNRIEAGVELSLPRPSWNITAAGPPGVNQIAVVVSRSPRDLSGTGIQEAGRTIPEFDLEDAARRWAAREGSASPFIGAVECRGVSGKFVCAEGYGARMIELEEVSGP